MTTNRKVGYKDNSRKFCNCSLCQILNEHECKNDMILEDSDPMIVQTFGKCLVK